MSGRGWLLLAVLAIGCSTEGPRVRSRSGLGDPTCSDPVADACEGGCQPLEARRLRPLDGCFEPQWVAACVRVPFTPLAIERGGCAVSRIDGRVYWLSFAEALGEAWARCDAEQERQAAHTSLQCPAA